MELPRDKNGKTETEFLRDYDVTKYFRPSVTVDAVLYCAESNAVKILFIRRGGHPYIGDYAFPGGFVEQDESCETAALRELNEETGLSGIALRQLVTASTPDRDPRWRNITVVYCGKLESTVNAVAGDDAAAAKWFDVKFDQKHGTLKLSAADGECFDCKLDIALDGYGEIDINNTKIVERGRLAFDHAKLVCYLLNELGKCEL